MWNQETDLKRLIENNVQRFEFFEATRWLRAISAELDREIKFRTATGKSFPSGQISDLIVDENKYEVFVNFFGLVGPCGVLPHMDKDLVSGASADSGLKGFLDVFDNRLIDLFYKVWSKNRQEIAFESYRRKLQENEDSSTLILMSLCGVSFNNVRQGCEFSDDVFPALSMFLTRSIRTVDAIEKCIATQFQIPVKTREFVKEKKYLGMEIRSQIGVLNHQYNQLGSDVVLGSNVDVFRERFEIELGPLSTDEFHSACPYGTKNQWFRKILDMILVTLGRPLDFDIRFNVSEEAVSNAKLCETRLGFDSWLTPAQDQSRNDPVKRFYWNRSREEQRGKNAAESVEIVG